MQTLSCKVKLDPIFPGFLEIQFIVFRGNASSTVMACHVWGAAEQFRISKSDHPTNDLQKIEFETKIETSKITENLNCCANRKFRRGYS